MRALAPFAAAAVLLLAAGCRHPAPPPDPAPAPPPEREVIVVLEAPEGSGLRHERPAILRVVDATTGAGV
ncbi:MAG: hypothetical protein ACYTGX_11575, partial [Planctomycetota bacterium]